MGDRYPRKGSSIKDPPRPVRLRCWPRTLGITGLVIGHLVFFLPFRAFVPIPSGVDPWWGMGLVVADGIVLIWLIRAWFRKMIRLKEIKGEG
ncbi:MAG: hypothetical protein ACE5HN_00075 [Nitrospiria bacterium]